MVSRERVLASVYRHLSPVIGWHLSEEFDVIFDLSVIETPCDGPWSCHFGFSNRASALLAVTQSGTQPSTGVGAVLGPGDLAQPLQEEAGGRCDFRSVTEAKLRS